MHIYHVVRFNLKKLKQIEDKEQYRIKTSGRFASFENVDTEVDINLSETGRVLNSSQFP
jgi:hypothetical protein